MAFKSTQVRVCVSSTPGQSLGAGDQLPDLRLVARNKDLWYTPRHHPEAFPPSPCFILLPQVVNSVGGFPPLLVLERTDQHKVEKACGEGDPHQISEDLFKRNVQNLYSGRGVHEGDREGASKTDLKTLPKYMPDTPLTCSPAHLSTTAGRRPQEVASSIAVPPAVRLDPGLPQ